MSQFHQVFFDEADEHLSSMESLLLGMDQSCPQQEDLHAVFRAAHSIKGGAATFGFADMADLTHVLEGLLDEVRRGARALSSDLVDLVLRAKDVLYGMLAAHKGKGEADAAQAGELKAQLEALAAAPAEAAARRAAPEEARHWTLYLEIDVVDGVDIDALLESLAEHGDLSVVQRGEEADKLPWVAVFTSQLDAAEVAESLAFALPQERFRINVDHGVEEEGSFGLFLEAEPEPEPEPDASVWLEGDGFGLFEPPPAEAAKRDETLSPAQESDAAKPAARGGALSESSIRVNIDKVDLLLNLVGELVITQSMLTQSGAGLDPVEHERLLGGIGALQRNARELQEAVMSIRMTPIAFVFNRFPRVVRDLAGRLGKRVELTMMGESTELDKGFIEKLSDPLTHLVRNSLDHGIESPEARQAGGKDPVGRLTLRAFHQGSNIVIEVSDDGAGLNRERILAKARQGGLAAPDSLSDAEVWNLIFEAGFSTAAEVTEVSGRGVGMDVVKRNIQSMGGRVEIDSMADIGTTISIHLPLTLAIMDGMSVRIGAETYVMPLGAVLESLQPAPDDIKTVAARGMVVGIRGEYLPIVPLGRFFSIPEAKQAPSEAILVIVEAGNSRLALLVDDLIGQQQFVVKNLETNYRKVDGISGATILGDGQVALILDIAAIARHNQRMALDA
ncbi:two-component system chemotaxis sensor kinase CheA [Chromobacterium alkanivorans]|uniref:chemotaxis protein CheW n=1 Tax=Chromobacterium alkanivorans TaxID=1071719 RepID=UPI00216769B9|nr:chemotaxis protein CheW [Chromobacterium alkanivorans]MCS3806319.1 two-component system chemotaxis sensor kinase CheA [Chromobacterium alkanivorans]MCS3820669.1 two-component system chemotaxis sensor kinase CheA [Chromobacterium alkanivorans]MCS3875427.1 two-component system chemotaxis sensor kinase CheA [Chromobacterium alkanivorans]